MRLNLFKTDIYPTPNFFMYKSEEYSEKTLEKARKRVLDLHIKGDSYCLLIFNCRKILIVYEYGKVVNGVIVPDKTILKDSPMSVQNRLSKEYKEGLKK